MYLSITIDKDYLNFFNYYYHLIKKMFSKVIFIFLKELLSDNKATINIIELKLIPKPPSDNMPVVVVKAVIKLKATIKSSYCQ